MTHLPPQKSFMSLNLFLTFQEMSSRLLVLYFAFHVRSPDESAYVKSIAGLPVKHNGADDSFYPVVRAGFVPVIRASRKPFLPVGNDRYVRLLRTGASCLYAHTFISPRRMAFTTVSILEVTCSLAKRLDT